MLRGFFVGVIVGRIMGDLRLPFRLLSSSPRRRSLWRGMVPATHRVSGGAAMWLALLVGCGGGGDGGGATPPAPVVVATVTVTPGTASLAVGGTQSFAATARSAAGVEVGGKTVTWNSATPSVATVNSAGTVTAVAPGTTSIVASIDGVSGSSTITVTPPAVASVVVTAPSGGLAVGQSVQLQASARDATGALLSGRAVVWSSSGPGVASVTATGLVTALTPGTTTVMATVEGISGTLPLTVTPSPVASLSVNAGGSTSLAIGQTVQLIADARDARGNALTGRTVTWSSSAPNVASVSNSGLVTAVAAGRANVIASVETLTASAGVTVVAPAPTCTIRQPFARDLIDPAGVKVLTQIGVVGGGNTSIVGRSYVFPLDNLTGVRVPVTAPAAGRLIGAGHYVPSGAPVGYTPDWSLFFDFGCGQSLELYHIKDLPTAVKAAIDTSISASSAWKILATPIPVAAGDPLGWYVKGPNSIAFDVVMWDTAVVNRFENQSRYDITRSNLLNVVCPWTQFEPGRRAAYLALIGAQTGVRTPAAGCGTVERDVPGTPAGQWFLSPTTTASWTSSRNGAYGDPLPIVLGSDSTVHIGHIGVAGDFRVDRGAPTWKDPATITTSWCYQSTQGSPGWLWLRMNSRLQMDAAYGATGSCPASFPTTGTMPYYR